MSKNKSRVTGNSKLTAVSSKPVGSGNIHPLSILDHAMGLHTLHVIFYYKQNLFGEFDVDPLRETLSEVLSLYPPVTGRLTRNEDGNWEVRCNDAGVRVIRANVGTTLDEWLRSADSSEERDLTVWDDLPDDPSTWSPFRIQVNEFEGGGVAIGLSCPHMNADPISLTQLFKSWTDFHRNGPITNPPIFRPFPLHGKQVANTDKTNSANFYANKSKTTHPKTSLKMASITFKFSNSIIKKCLDEIQENCPNATPFDFLVALFWKRIARIKGPKNDCKFSLKICTDFRKLTSLQGLRYFGNALHFLQVAIDVEEMNRSGVGNVASAVHQHLSSLDEEEIFSVVEWLESQKGGGRKFGEPLKMYGPELTCINMENMIVPCKNSGSLMYAAMFSKDAKPVHVSYHFGNAEGEGLIVVMPSTEEGLARAVMVMLPEEELVELCDDQTILSLKPTILLSGK